MFNFMFNLENLLGCFLNERHSLSQSIVVFVKKKIVLHS